LSVAARFYQSENNRDILKMGHASGENKNGPDWMAVSPLNTIPLLPSFRGSVDFCNFVHRGGSGNRASNR
jgi:hypothetical protein